VRIDTRGASQLTFQIGALLFPEGRAGILQPGGQRYLNVSGHGLLGRADGPRLLRLLHHVLNPLYGAMAIVETLGDLLREPLDLALLGLLSLVVVEAGQDVLLVQPLERVALGRNDGEKLRHLVADVGPTRREEVHLYDGVAVVLEGASRKQTAAVVLAVAGAGEAVREAIAARGPLAVRGPFCRVVRIRLSVGDVSCGEPCQSLGAGDAQRNKVPFFPCYAVLAGGTYRLVRSRHMADATRRRRDRLQPDLNPLSRM
jgi:hypothetical protein